MYRSRALIKTGGRCAVTNSRVVDACHVVPRSGGNKNLRALTGKPDITVDDAKNLICLNPVLHRLFDAYKFSFAPVGHGLYLIEPYVSDPLLDLHLGKPIRLDACSEILELHRRKCLEINTQSKQRRTVRLIGGNRQTSEAKHADIHLLRMSETDGVLALTLTVPGLSDEDLAKAASQHGILKPQLQISAHAAPEQTPTATLCIAAPIHKEEIPEERPTPSVDPPGSRSGPDQANVQLELAKDTVGASDAELRAPSKKSGDFSAGELEARLIDLYPTVSVPLLENTFSGCQNNALAFAFKKHGNKVPLDDFIRFLNVNEIPTKNWKANPFIRSCGTIGDTHYALDAASRQKVSDLWQQYLSSATDEMAGVRGFLEDLFKDNTVASESAKFTLAGVQIAKILPMAAVTDAIRSTGAKTNNYSASLERKHMRFLVRRSGNMIHGLAVQPGSTFFQDFEKQFRPYLVKMRENCNN
jgi:hypothetical protein